MIAATFSVNKSSLSAQQSGHMPFERGHRAAWAKKCHPVACVSHRRIMDVKAHQTLCLKMHERPKKLPLPVQNRAITGACYLPEPPGRKW